VRSLSDLRRYVSDGYRFVHRTPVVRNAMWVDFWATFFSSADALIPAFAKDILKVGPRGFGLLASASAIGGFVAALYMSSRRTVVNQGRWVIASIAAYGICTVAFALSPNLFIATVFLAGTGAADMISTVLRQTIRALATPDRMRGRMTAFSQIFNISGPQLGDFEAGVLAKPFGERWSVTLGGLACLGVAALWSRSPLRVYEHEDD
jgi:MFS family permease